MPPWRVSPAAGTIWPFDLFYVLFYTFPANLKCKSEDFLPWLLSFWERKRTSCTRKNCLWPLDLNDDSTRAGSRCGRSIHMLYLLFFSGKNFTVGKQSRTVFFLLDLRSILRCKNIRFDDNFHNKLNQNVTKTCEKGLEKVKATEGNSRPTWVGGSTDWRPFFIWRPGYTDIAIERLWLR